jgi:2-keto-4-pentenoate hydratase/2-oxohepta-3-ene-1,7-dioic acid hydratase in catechol pathway
MRLASVESKGRDILAVQFDDQHLIDLSAPIRAIAPHAEFDTMLDLIEAGVEGLGLARRAYETALRPSSHVERIPMASVAWYAPVRNPGKIVCLALNNSANKDRIIRGPSHPATFIKPASALIGHGRAIECKSFYGRTHPEPELAVVIGKAAKGVPAANALHHVIGYTIHNDITSPTMRGEDTFHYRAIHPRDGEPDAVDYVDTWVSYPGRYKCADTFACMGPWLVTADEIADPHDLVVQCHHQGRLMTEDNTANLFHKVPEVIAFISDYMTLLPGDIISMGTALLASGNVGAVQNIDLNKLGGPISVTIQGIGTLLNHVVRS